MPRRPRVVLPHIPLHLIQRGNNRQVCFVADEDYRVYLDWLKEFAGKTGCISKRRGSAQWVADEKLGFAGC